MLILLKLVVIFIFSLLILYASIRFAIYKKWYQPIYHLSPISHQDKQGVPSIGGFVIVVSIFLGSGLCGLWGIFDIMWLLLIMAMFAFIGFIDDVMAIVFKTNKGLSVSNKFILQILFSFIVVFIWAYYVEGFSLLLVLIYSLIMTGASNATNLTDGLDGLLGGSMVISLLGMLIVGWCVFPSYILIFIAVMIMVVLAFLIFNVYPAKVFMGDTGALMMGAVLTGLALIFGNIWILLPFGFVYVIETVSVILQVTWFKRTHQRLFLMAPLHHHFEKLGVSESSVVYVFWIFGAVGVVVGCCYFFI